MSAMSLLSQHFHPIAIFMRLPCRSVLQSLGRVSAHIQLSKIKSVCGFLVIARRTLAKDLSFDSSKSTLTPLPIVRYAISQTCHLERLKAWFFTAVSPIARLPRAPFSVLCSPFSLFLGRRSHKNGRFNAKPKKSACISDLGVVSYGDFLMESANAPPMRKARAPRVRVRLCLRSSVGRALPW